MTGPELLTKWDRVGIMPSTTRGWRRGERGRGGGEEGGERRGSGIMRSPTHLYTSLLGQKECTRLHVSPLETLTHSSSGDDNIYRGREGGGREGGGGGERERGRGERERRRGREGGERGEGERGEGERGRGRERGEGERGGGEREGERGRKVTSPHIAAAY